MRRLFESGRDQEIGVPFFLLILYYREVAALVAGVKESIKPGQR